MKRKQARIRMPPTLRRVAPVERVLALESVASVAPHDREGERGREHNAQETEYVGVHQWVI